MGYRCDLPEIFISALHARLGMFREIANDYHAKFKTALYEPWRFVDQKAVEPITKSFIPPVPALADLIMTTLWASLEREEGRPVRFSVDFVPPVLHDKAVMPFEDVLRFDGQIVVRLAPAVGTYGASLCVWSFLDGQLGIWGRQVGVGPALRVIAVDPGFVVVNFGEFMTVATIKGGEAWFVGDKSMNMAHPVWNRFLDGKPDDPFDRGRLYHMQALYQIARSIRFAQHGGTIIVVPPNESWRDCVSTMTCAMSRPYSHLADQINFLHQDKQSGSTFAERLRPFTRDIALLANVDGAVVLNTRLEVLGFGAKLQAGSSSRYPERLALLDPREREPKIQICAIHELGQTRHQSAARFICDNRDAMAIVVSQDGHVTLMYWAEPTSESDDGLLMAHRIELSCV